METDRAMTIEEAREKLAKMFAKGSTMVREEYWNGRERYPDYKTFTIYVGADAEILQDEMGEYSGKRFECESYEICFQELENALNRLKSREVGNHF